MGGIHKNMNAARDKSINSESLQRINLCSSKQLHTTDVADVASVKG